MSTVIFVFVNPALGMLVALLFGWYVGKRLDRAAHLEQRVEALEQRLDEQE